MQKDFKMCGVLGECPREAVMCLISNVCVLVSEGEGIMFCAQHVFVQGVCVSCHCGPQSTVVQSRVRQLQVLDPQRN